MKIEAVIFDLDGTLTDSLPDIVTAANLLLRNHGLKAHSISDYKKWIGHGAYALLEKALPEKKEGFDVDQLLHEYIDLYGKVCKHDTTVYAGILNLLESLNKKRIPICILTNKPDKITKEIVNHFFPTIHFHYIAGQMPDVPIKPDPSMAIKIVRSLNIKAGNTLFVGDSETDIKTAKNAGMIAAGVSWGYGSKVEILNAACDRFFKSVQELKDFIFNTNDA